MIFTAATRRRDPYVSTVYWDLNLGPISWLAVEQCHKIFYFWFFHESSSSKPLKITLGSFQIFSQICGDIHKSSCTTGINDTGGKFSNGINNTRGIFWHRYCWWSWYRWQICRLCQWHQYCHCLPLVSRALVANNWNLVLRGIDSWKKPEVKNFVALSLKVSYD